ncbi:basic leucine zipper 61-like [Zingiber officinale]|uniref:basic leucine zipper 61-like n=1 Tax=Zingiber officinale TaxID=94328 RepID=UPI001C4C70D4|nr:basic leucine zipper 61-like [Zingiber officinale]
MYVRRSAAQLPPKSPTAAAAPSHLPRHDPSSAAMLAAAQQPPAWVVDEFLDFSAARRGHRRRSASDDSVAFLVDEAGGFDDRLVDEDQLMSMFSDELVPAPQTSSSTAPSDHNSVNEEKPAAPAAGTEEAQSLCKTESETAGSEHPAVDPKRVKRILANRQSAQRSRVRKLQYISELERSVTSLQNEVSALSPRVAFLDHQRSILTMGNSHLKQRIAALAQDRIFKDAHQEALKKEIERLRQVYEEQNLDKNHKRTAASEPVVAVAAPEKELLC